MSSNIKKSQFFDMHNMASSYKYEGIAIQIIPKNQKCSPMIKKKKNDFLIKFCLYNKIYFLKKSFYYIDVEI